jgi:hypothetical protein
MKRANDDDSTKDATHTPAESTDKADSHQCNVISLEENSKLTILSALRSDHQVKRQGKWQNMSLRQLDEMLETAENLDKSMTLVEVKVLLKTLKQLFPMETTHIRLSSPKGKLVNDMLQVLGKQIVI